MEDGGRMIFSFEKETKNCLRFKEEGEGLHAVGTLYVKKWALPMRPRSIVVQIIPQQTIEKKGEKE